MKIQILSNIIISILEFMKNKKTFTEPYAYHEYAQAQKEAVVHGP